MYLAAGVFCCVITIISLIYVKNTKLKSVKSNFPVVAILIVAVLILFLLIILFLYGSNFKVKNNMEKLLDKAYPSYFPHTTEKESEPVNENTTGPFKYITSKIQHFYFTYIKKSIYTYIIILLLILLIFSIMKFDFYRSYKSRLRNIIYKVDHPWLANKTISHLLISVNVISTERLYEYDLVEYFKLEFSKKTNGVYVILGNAGEGKTVSLKKVASLFLELSNNKMKVVFINICIKVFFFIWNLAIRLLTGHDKVKMTTSTVTMKAYIPIIFEFRELMNRRTNQELIELVMNKVTSPSKFRPFWRFMGLDNKLKSKIEFDMKIGNFLFLIDGYDEVQNDNMRDSITRTLGEFLKEYPECFYVITSRTSIFMEEKFIEEYITVEQENVLYLSPLSKAKIFEFLSKWSFPEGKSKRVLYENILNNIQLEKIASNPLLLTLISHLYSNMDFKFSNSITEFYKESMKCLLDEWEKSKSLPKRFKSDLETKSSILSHFAYYLHLNGIPSLDKKSFQILIRDIIIDDKDISPLQGVEEVYHQTGLLEKLPDQSFKFYHRSFLEYFVALHFIEKKINILDLEKDMLHNKEILAFYYSLNNQSKLTEDFINRNYKYSSIVEQLIIECNIEDNNVIQRYVEDKTKNINYNDIRYFQTIGIIAAKYDKVKDYIYRFLEMELKFAEDTSYIQNIILSLSYFANKADIAYLIT